MGTWPAGKGVKPVGAMMVPIALPASKLRPTLVAALSMTRPENVTVPPSTGKIVRAGIRSST